MITILSSIKIRPEYPKKEMENFHWEESFSEEAEKNWDIRKIRRLDENNYS
jgi:hypothetical protein